MKKFQYGKTYIVERDETSVIAFEVIDRVNGCLNVYVRTYTPETKELKAFTVGLCIFDDGIQEMVEYQSVIKATDFYESKVSIFTKLGLGEYDEKANT